MGWELYENYEVARETFEEASAALGCDVARQCFEGPAELLNETANTQPAIVTVSVAAWRVWQERTGGAVRPEMAAGLSLGEYSALVAAGALQFRDAVALVRRRGQYMQEAVPLGVGAMAAVLGLEREQVEDACRQAQSELAAAGRDVLVAPANYNCPGQIVIAGHAEAVSRAGELAKAAGAKRVVPLPVSAPFHCGLMQPAADRLAGDLAGIDIQPAQIPVVANVTAEPVREPAAIRPLLIRQVSAPVRWEDSVRRMVRDGVTHFLELGPGRTLSGFVKKIAPEAVCSNVENLDSLGKALDSWKGVC